MASLNISNTDTANPQTVIAQKVASVSGSTSVEQFPADLPLHYAKLTFVKYARANPNSTPTDSITANIILPIPSQLLDSSSFQYAGNEAGILGNIPGINTKTWSKQLGDANESMNKLKKQYEENGLLDTAWQLLTNVPGSQDFQLGRLLGASTGKIFNPHLSTIFQGVDLRKHQFTWRLSPRNQQETKAISAIDAIFKARIHPSLSNNGFSLDYPDQLYIKFYPESPDFTYKVRKSSVVGYTLNDAATGTPAWFAGTNAPTDYELSLSLQEVDIVTRDELTGKS